jgi:hypothetical protein
MIAIGIVTTWLALTAAGFAGLSLLDRAGAREERELCLTPAELQSSALADARIPIPKALLR